jgi:hypothetical protein
VRHNVLLRVSLLSSLRLDKIDHLARYASLEVQLARSCDAPSHLQL